MAKMYCQVRLDATQIDQLKARAGNVSAGIRAAVAAYLDAPGPGSDQTDTTLTPANPPEKPARKTSKATATPQAERRTVSAPGPTPAQTAAREYLSERPPLPARHARAGKTG